MNPASPSPPREGGATTPRARRWPVRPLVFLLVVAPFAWLAWQAYGAFVGGSRALGSEPIRELELATGEWTIRFLALTLALTPARRLFGWNGLAKYRRMFGLFTFFYASVHLALWVGVDWFFDIPAMAEEIAEKRYILVGMAAFLVLVPLAVTSTKGWIRRLGGGRWNRLHRLTYLAAVLGTIHYLWAVKKDLTNPLIFAAIFAILFGVRIWWRVRGRDAAGSARGRPAR